MKKLVLVSVFLALSALSSVAFAFNHEETRIIVRDQTALSGEWLLPEGEVKAVALLLQGSGNVGRDGDVTAPILGTPYRASAAKLSLQLAEALASAGVASLRFDKRGFEDPAQLPKQIPSILIQDAEDAVAAARARFHGRRIFLVGFSEGALLASFVARAQPVDGLFLLAPPTRTADELFHYQFVDWPTNLLRKHLPVDRDDSIALADFASLGVTRLPLAWLLNVLDKPLAAFDLDHDGRLSVSREIETAYAHEGLAQLQAVLESPGFAAWYHDLKALPAVREFASGLQSPFTYVYQALDDAQVNPAWAREDLPRFPGHVALRTFADFGHCFSPMLGKIGEQKTTGPIDPGVLDALASDAREVTR